MYVQILFNLILNLKYSFLTMRKSVAKGANWREQKKKKNIYVSIHFLHSLFGGRPVAVSFEGGEGGGFGFPGSRRGAGRRIG